MTVTGALLGTEHLPVLERIAGGAPLLPTLEALARVVEQQAPGMRCSLLLLDHSGRYLRHGAAPSLPRDYVRAIDGIAIGPDVGSCGTAAHRRERVVVEDLATHPYWTRYRHLALPHGLRACWSTPILSSGTLLGTLAMYYDEPRGPSDAERMLIEAMVHLAAIAIARHDAETAQRRIESHAQHVAQLNAMCNAVASALVRQRDEGVLVESACRIAVEGGMATLAWVGAYDEASDRIVPQARFGCSAAYLERIDLSLRGEDIRHGPAAKALLTGEPSVTADITTDPDFHWKETALDHGLRSCAVFPLRLADGSRGVFALYHGEPGFFGEVDVRALTILADTLSFALESARTHRERQQALVTLAERVKELTLLHAVARMLQSGRALDEALLREVVALIPAAMQFAQHCVARVRVGDLEAATPGWEDRPAGIEAPIDADGIQGSIEVGYREPVTGDGQDPFLDEERTLLRSLADMLGAHAARVAAAPVLRESPAG